MLLFVFELISMFILLFLFLFYVISLASFLPLVSFLTFMLLYFILCSVSVFRNVLFGFISFSVVFLFSFLFSSSVLLLSLFLF